MYAGSTKDLMKRMKQHRRGYQKGFTQRYNINRLICYEIFEYIDKAKAREKEVKGWRREKKIKLIESKNKQWKDLYDELLRDPSFSPSLRSGSESG